MCLKFSSLGQLIFSFYIRIFVKTTTLGIKIDQLIKSVDLLRTEMQNIYPKFDSMESRLAKLEDKVENQQETFPEKTFKKADIEEVSILKKQVEKLENELKFSVQKQRKQEAAKEACSKRLNLLIHGQTESTNPWEKREEIVEKYENFVSDGLKLDPASINVANIHRLPRHPIYKNGKKITRPVIIKLSSVFDKQSIFKAVKNLKNFNQNSNSKVYITEHLPAEFIKQKQALT